MDRETIARIGLDIDLHMHSTASDGTDTPEVLLENVKKNGLRFFSVTDHDTYETGEALLASAALEAGPRFVLGIELSCKDELGKYHILGYRFDPDCADMRQIVDRAHDNRVFKVLNRLKFLREEFGFMFTTDEMDELMALPNPGKPHIGNLMVKHGYAPDRTAAIRDYLNKYKGKTPFVRPEEAIGAILAGGGIPVLAHPLFGNGDQELSVGEVAERTDRLMREGLQGLECFYSRNTREQTDALVELAEERGIFSTCGSDYHGGNKAVPLGMTGLRERDRVPAPLIRFMEAV